MSFNNVRHLTTKTITTLQHFATLHHTSPNYISLHLSTLHLLSFTLHYPPTWRNPFAFPYLHRVGNRREGDYWGDLGVDGWIVLGWISRRWDVGLWTGLGWPRIETGGGRL